MLADRKPTDLAGRTVLITGSTGGIGKATALGLATMNARVLITGRDRARAGDTAREIEAAAGGEVDVFVADLSSQSGVRRLPTRCSSGIHASTC
jgi:retinol dehydrogenase 14